MNAFVATIKNLETGATQSSEPFPMLANAVGAGARMLYEHVTPWPRDEGWGAFRALMKFREIQRGGYNVKVSTVTS